MAIKSAIQEVRDQLFLDRADGKYLDVVTSNLGMDRPNLGFSDDDVWRAVVRRLALDTKQVVGVFSDLLDLIFGPSITAATVLTQDAAAGDEEIYLADWMNVPQTGTLVLDEGGADEETVEYTFRDPRTGEVLLREPLVNAHTAAIDTAESFLSGAAVATDTIIVVRRIDSFPSTGFPYSLIINPGEDEEVVQLTGRVSDTGDSFAFGLPVVTFTKAGANFPTSLIGTRVSIAGATSGGNDGTFVITGVPGPTQLTWNNTNGAAEAFPGTWTLLRALEISALVNNHGGPTASFVTSGLAAISPSAGVITLDASDNFPAKGVVRVQEDGGAPVEDVEYTSNDIINEQLQLFTKLVSPYTINAAEVTLLNDGVAVKLAQAQMKGAGWLIFETDPRVLRILIPEVLEENRLLDASFLHGPIVGATPTTVAGAHAIGDTTLAVADASTFPSAGNILINAVEAIAYTRLTPSTVLYSNDPTGIPIGTMVLFVENAAAIFAFEDITHDLVIDMAGVPENVTWTAIDVEANTITLLAATGALHATGEGVNLRNPGVNDLRLSRVLVNNYVGGEAVAVIENAYGGFPALEEGEIYTATDHLYQGSYVWEILRRIAEVTKTSLDDRVAGPTYLVASQQAQRTALEAKDAALLLADFREIEVGRGLGSRETVQVNDITLQRSVAGVTVNGVAITGDLTLTVSGASGLPEAWGYRLFLDDNVSGTDEEIVIVKSFDGAVTVVLETPLAYNHSIGDKVQLLADVLTVDALAYGQKGQVKQAELQYLIPGIGTDWALGTRDVAGIPNARVAKVEEIRTYITVVDASIFSPDGGYAQINFGRNINKYESQLTANEAAASAFITVDVGAGFPLANFFVHIGVGSRVVETIEVANRAGNILTLADNLYHNHRAGEWVEYLPGEWEEVVYTGTETAPAVNERLLFEPGISFTQDHLYGEPVALSSERAMPINTGTDYPFYLPSRWQDRLEFLIDLARAAGVRVFITTDR